MFVESSPLDCGEPCLKHNCALCCHETRMPLTYLDLNRIVKLGYAVKSFAERSGGNWKLKNIDGKCLFLSGSTCKIYRFRPYGCRLYPLIYDQNKHKIMLDNLCPYKDEFNVQVEDLKKLMLILRMLRSEIHF
ncbi:MAG: YkgJ family cysteine cluster protein [Candidatus Bathyarchaeota archaeon]|nr:YkgJ family cysteine cluster protein [Candidatus Bathyarchaeota archaeon]